MYVLYESYELLMVIIYYDLEFLSIIFIEITKEILFYSI